MKFQKAGCILVDATYRPVNKLKDKEANKIISEDYPMLVADLRELTRNSKPDIILVKANVCDLLEKQLLEDGFNVINEGRRITFPSTGQQKNFHHEMEAILA